MRTRGEGSTAHTSSAPEMKVRVCWLVDGHDNAGGVSVDNDDGHPCGNNNGNDDSYRTKIGGGDGRGGGDGGGDCNYGGVMRIVVTSITIKCRACDNELEIKSARCVVRNLKRPSMDAEVM